MARLSGGLSWDKPRMRNNFSLKARCGENFKDIRTKDKKFIISLGQHKLPAQPWQAEIKNEDDRIITHEEDRVLATRSSFGRGEVLWVPQQIELAARTNHHSSFRRWQKMKVCLYLRNCSFLP